MKRVMHFVNPFRATSSSRVNPWHAAMENVTGGISRKTPLDSTPQPGSQIPPASSSIPHRPDRS